MTTTDVAAPPVPDDPAVPGTRELVAGGSRVLGAFLDERGWTLDTARPAQMAWRPGRSIDVRFQARVHAPGGDARQLTLCIERAARPKPPPLPPARFEARYGLADPVGVVDGALVWAFPYDPALPGLFDAAQGAAVRDALGATGRRPRGVAVQPLRYRPRRRAVFHYLALHHDRSEIVYGKVLRPDRAAQLVEDTSPLTRRRRRGLRLGLPHGHVDGGALLLPALAGRSLRDLLLAGDSLPSPDRVAALLDDLPRRAGRRAPTAASGRSDAVHLAEHARRLLTRLVPDAAGDVERAVDTIIEEAERDDTPRRLVHGDLYEAQVVVDDDYSLGLIDLDDLGVGDPALDAANFCAHLIALGQSVPTAWRRLSAYRVLARAAFLRRLEIAPEALAWREALATLLLASGPFRVLHPCWPREVGRRVDVAVRLLADAA